MPGFILHLTSAKMLLNQLPDHPHFPYMIASENDFMTGSLLPDATANKNRTHFRNLLYADKMMLWPDLKRFLPAIRISLQMICISATIFIFILINAFLKIIFPRSYPFTIKKERLPTSAMRSALS